VLNAANEIAVSMFLAGRLGFTTIAQVIAETMNAHEVEDVSTLDTVRKVDAWAREYALARTRELELRV
jgi:1-deoxy-D-xylulose-5-phosphate reductoisomerase